ncbi:MAG: hypothetical protein LBS59_04545 [Puniceicoccales bacterium]|nr:hypothetical protein [Puniceicoccales bacterium]
MFLFLCLIARLVSLQLLDAEEYKMQADTQSRRLVILPAPRGNIYDRNGVLLVGNRPAHNIVVDIAGMRKEFDLEFSRLRATDRAWQGLNTRLDSLAHKTQAEREAWRKQQAARAIELREIAQTNVLQRQLNKLRHVLARSGSLDVKEVARHLSPASRRRTLPFTLVRDISPAQMALFIENIPADSPLRLVTESVRDYRRGTTAAHVLGFVSSDRSPKVPDAPENSGDDPDLTSFLALNAAERENLMLKHFDGQRAVSGVEACFDKEVLRGKPGCQLWTVRPSGFAFEEMASLPSRQGTHLYLSLDIALQEAAERELTRRFPQNRACVIVLDVVTGEVLVCANSPSFDPARMRERAYYEEQAERGVLLNRATQGLFPPGSSFKPITAIAALRSGKITPETIKQCDSVFFIGKKRFVEHDGRAFGEVDLRRMLQVSSNVYCYQAGLDVGIDGLAAEAKRFGLDSPTTLELHEKPRGLVIPTPEYKRRRHRQGWALGDTANAAIGQGDTVTTPMHLAAMTASIARGETRTDITLRRVDSDAAPRKHSGEPIGLSSEQYRALIDGLAACAKPGGTGRLVTQGLASSLHVAAKTGTAQIKNNTANLAWTVAFAPIEKPKIAIAVLIEGIDGNRSFGGGANAAPVANVVLAEWLKLEKKYANQTLTSR